MEATSKTLSYTPAWLLSVLLFFLNEIPYAGGLTLSLVLTPAWLWVLYQWQFDFRTAFKYLAPVFGIYAAVHFSGEVTGSYYLISTVMLLAAMIYGITGWYFFQLAGKQLDGIFRTLLILNFLLTLVAFAFVGVSPVRELLWYTMSISQDIEPIPRLKLFTSEASHYSYLFAPLAIYFLSRIFFSRVERPGLLLLMIFLPLTLSFSLGVLLVLCGTGVLMLLLYHRSIFRNTQRRKWLLYIVLFLLGTAVLLYFVYPDNPLYLRISNIFEGKDTSARGRTYESFILAHKITGLESYWFGIGPGQMKIYARDLIIQYYQYTEIPPVVRIPNACADTIVCYGYLGLAARLGVQILLFFSTRVAANPFRLWLFLFLFLFQFTGSYINNTVEFLLWGLAFAPVFNDFKTKLRS